MPEESSTRRAQRNRALRRSPSSIAGFANLEFDSRRFLSRPYESACTRGTKVPGSCAETSPYYFYDLKTSVGITIISSQESDELHPRLFCPPHLSPVRESVFVAISPLALSLAVFLLDSPAPRPALRIVPAVLFRRTIASEWVEKVRKKWQRMARREEEGSVSRVSEVEGNCGSSSSEKGIREASAFSIRFAER